MNPGIETQVQGDANDQNRRRLDVHLNRLFEEVARLSESDLSTGDYYAEFLQRVVSGISAPAGAIWVRTPQGNLQLQYQIGLAQIGLDKTEAVRLAHNELLRQASQTPQPIILPPRSGPGTTEDGKAVAGNPTDLLVLLAPILVDKGVVALVEIWQHPERSPAAQRGFVQFVGHMAALASHYARNRQLRQITGQQQVWTQLETFARQVHGSLDPTKVAYLVANEGRRLVECDRISVAIRMGQRTAIEAISGANIVEKRSNLVQLMRALCDRVLNWGEKLVYAGTKDDSLPPDVLKALDAYLAESTSKLLVVLPLRLEGDADEKKPLRSALLLESFEPTVPPEQMVARLEIVGRHAGTALSNAVEHRRIPMRWIWQPLAHVQEGLGGKARTIAILSTAAAFLLLVALVVVPYPLKMDANGQLLPTERGWVFSPFEAEIVRFDVIPGQNINEDHNLVLMRDLTLAEKLQRLKADIDGAQLQMDALVNDLAKPGLGDLERSRLSAQREQKKVERDSKIKVLQNMLQRIRADNAGPGHFWLKSPMNGTVLNWEFRENRNRPVKPSDPILRLGNKEGPWEIELKIPQKHIGQVLQAFGGRDTRKKLDVDLLLLSAPTRTFKGKLTRDQIAGEATPNRDDNNESEPVVLATVRIDDPDIPAAERIPKELLLTGTEVHSKIRCGDRAMGYSLFYGLWEFFYEKVVFFF